jgi:hypothetical protein
MAVAMDGSELPTKPLPVPPKKAMEDLLASMTDMKAQHVPSMIGIYGDQGTGKTVAGMKYLQKIVPPHKKILYVDSAANWTSLMNHPELMERVKLMEYENMEQLQVLARMLRISEELREKIGGVMLDEYSVMSARDQAWIVRVRAEQVNEDYFAGKAGAKYKDPFQPTLPDYLGQKLRSGEAVNDFLVSKTHTVFIAHEKLDDIKIIQPDFPEKTGKEWQRLLHGVFHATYEVQGDKELYPMQLKPFNRISAKNRIGGLGRFATIEQVAEAYLKWGITQEEVKGIVEPSVEVTEESSDDDEALALKKLLGQQ